MNDASDASASAAREADRQPSRRSLRGLDWLNFSMADVQNGIGPFLATFLKGSQHWGAGHIGLALAVSNIAGAASQVPAGMLVDATRFKRCVVAGAAILIAAGSLAIAVRPVLAWVLGAQVLIGVASAVLPPALAALCLGLVGHRRMPRLLSRNQAFSHAGAFTSAVLIAAGGRLWGYDWIFYLLCLFAAGLIASVFTIRPGEIDHELARGGEQHEAPVAMRRVVGDRRMLVYLGAVVLFHFGNAAMLPMAAQVIARAHPGSDTVALSACVIAAQAVMMGVAVGVGRLLDRGCGRRPIVLVMFATLPLRGALFAVLAANPYAVVAIQLLDGVGAGLFSVISVIIAADLTRGTGRFNLAQGLVALSVGIGGALSNLSSGYVVQWTSYPVGFLYLAAVALGGLTLFARLMPETRP